MDEIKENGNNHKRKKMAFGVLIVVVIVGIVATFLYIQYKSRHITTDDAFVTGNIHTVASKVPGTVKAVYVKSNQYVKAGDILVELVSADFDVRVKEASSSMIAEKAKLIEAESRIEAAKRQLDDAISKADAVRAMNELQQVNLEQAERDKLRAEKLEQKDAISKERMEKTVTAYKVALAQVKAASEGLKSYMSTIETQKAMIKQAEAMRTAQLSSIKQKEAVLEGANLNYSYVKISAPADGYVTKKSVEIGNQVQPGQPLMAVVSLDDLYIVANYKETQLEKIKPGQKVKVKVDTFSGKVFNGTVDSIMAGTGATFSLFPPENATGNYVKIVQRIPVKILLEKNADPEHILRVGMSVVPTVLVEK